MLDQIVDRLADPADLTPLHLSADHAQLISESGHAYDIAKQGYVSLFAGARSKHPGDTAEMIRARETFLGGGLFSPFVEAMTDAVHEAVASGHTPVEEDVAVVDVGAGTGYYIAHTLDSVDRSVGIALDISTAAARRLASAHPRLGAVVADAWKQFPIATGSVDVITSAFAPRNPEEFARILKPAGRAIILSADPGHLSELRQPLGILDVKQGKLAEIIGGAAGYLEPVGESQLVTFTMDLDRESIHAQVGMSPSAHHIPAEELARRVATLPEQMTVTARAMVTVLEKRSR
ncbi:MAG: methyltransferase domain-containing protein [Corynebacterium sp.]|nr:methyltransferase domain-containing protein [Corynebacterium sp.]